MQKNTAYQIYIGKSCPCIEKTSPKILGPMWDVQKSQKNLMCKGPKKLTTPKINISLDVYFIAFDTPTKNPVKRSKSQDPQKYPVCLGHPNVLSFLTLTKYYL